MNKEALYKIKKMQNNDKVVLVKYGNFYKTYNEDALIIWDVFGYKVKNNLVCFPSNVFSNVVSKLNRLGINVIVINKENDISYYNSTRDNNYNLYKDKSNIEYNKDIKINQVKLLVEEKLENSFINYDKLIEFLNTL